MMAYPLLDPDAPTHRHDGGDCPACWTVVRLLAEQAQPLINSIADDIGSPDPRLDRIVDLLAAHHALSYTLYGLATLVSRLRPGRFSLAHPAGPAGSHQQAAVTATNELLDAAGRRRDIGTVMDAVWALEPAGRRDVAAILGYAAGMLLGELSPAGQRSMLMLLATPMPAGTLRAVPMAAAISALLADPTRAADAMRLYSRVAVAEPELLPRW